MTIAAVREAWKYRQAQFLAILHGLDAWASIHHTGILWTLGILYKFVLDALYIWAASPQYAYAGLVYQPDSIKYIAAAVMYGLLFAALPRQSIASRPFCFICSLPLPWRRSCPFTPCRTEAAAIF